MLTLFLIICLGVGGMIVVLDATGKCKLTSEQMLSEYDRTLAELREQRAREAELEE